MNHHDLIQLVIQHINHITPFARAAHAQQGRGVVVTHIDALTNLNKVTKDTESNGVTNRAEDTEAPEVNPNDLFNYVPLTYIPNGDDFRPIIAEYNPETEFVILLGGLENDGEALLKLNQDGSGA